MPDRRFYQTSAALSVDEALTKAQGVDESARLIGQSDGNAIRVGQPDEADLSGAVVYCQRTDVAAMLDGRRFALAIAAADHASTISAGGPVIETTAARHVFAEIARRLHAPRIDDGGAAEIGVDVLRHPTAVIGAGAEVGARCVLGPYAVIGPGVKLGADCVIGTSASVHFSKLGDRVRLLTGARLGEDGFGFVATSKGALRVPQLGRLIVGDDVEIGANATIDRGALGDTVIGDGTKIDNLVHIAHNVQIGRNCFIAGQVGFAGSCRVGDGVMIGGQAGIADHITIGDGARIAAQAGLVRDVPAGESWGGTPAMPGRTWLRAATWAARQSRRKTDEK